MGKFESSFSNKLIYVFSINDEKHKGCLKVGDASIKVMDSEINNLPPNCSKLNQAARERIGHYTTTAGVEYKLEYTELAMRRNAKDPSIWEYFRDYQVRNVLYNSGIQKKKIGNAKEWVVTNLPTVINAIKATKENKKSLSSGQIVSTHDTIDFRPEQTDAIEMTIKQFKTKNSMLWNAKMRFGKTLSALEVVKREQFKKVIIITHRPVVKDSWGEDFHKIFDKNDGYHFSLKSNESERLSVLKDCLERNEPVIHFASIQDLRGSALVGGSFDKNKLIFDINWDLVIIDEAHEGTLTSLGDEVKKAIIKEDTYGKTKVLMLSGTPFNLVDDFDADQIYTWDYVMEQKAKAEWDSLHALDSNPYDSLPKLEIYTYNLGTVFKDYESAEDKAFNFNEFFRTWTGYVRSDGRALPEGVNVGDFVHENDVRSFINLLVKEDKNSNYPFSTEEYRDYFRHTLWMLPGVKEAKAFSKLLKENKVFGSGAFEIVNVAGDGDEEQSSVDALEAVNKAITDHPENTYTITLSCGRLTTGVSVKPWTAVMMLAGSYSTSAANYLQTIFRVQTPANINGRMKDRCYVFDFAPDRTLKMVAEAGKLGTKPGQGNSRQDEVMTEFLNFCPVIAISGSQMKPYDVNAMLQQIKKVYAERVVLSGFSDTRLYNDELLKLDELDLKLFDQLKDIAKKNKATESSDIDLNRQGLSDEEHEEVERIEKKKKKREPLTEEELKRLEELKQAKTQRGKAIKILRAISIRIPMLIYGMDADFDEDITLEKFVDAVDDNSWLEFMPKGVTKELFNKFKKYYDKDIFIAAGKKIRALVKGADTLPVEERIKRITEIFATFKNPDKETVLTPWRVVNMHLSAVFGGYNFFDGQFKDLLPEPVFVDKGKETQEIFGNKQVKILEINSKSGLYPLYVTYSLYREKCFAYDEEDLTFDLTEKLWRETLENNVYIICKTPMAKRISRRTLLGYKDGKVNARYFDDLVAQFENKMTAVVDKITRKSYWNKDENGTMKFDAVVGNPPYQLSSENTSDKPIYNVFMDGAFSISDKVSFITPARFLFNAGKTPNTWNQKMLNDEHFKVVWYKANSTDVFPNVDIKGGVAVTYRNAKEKYPIIGTFTDYNELETILDKVKAKTTEYIDQYVYAPESYKFTDKLYSLYPQAKGKLSKGHDYDVTTNILDKLPFIFTDKKTEENCVGILGRTNNERALKYIVKGLMTGPENFEFYKVFLPASNGSGAIGEVLSTPVVGHPVVGHTQTFISIGKFEREGDANACLKYIKSKFVRCMLGILKVTQHNKKPVWKYVPMQDFTASSDIDWSKSIPEIDSQLYKKYGLSDEEVKFIEAKILPM